MNGWIDGWIDRRKNGSLIQGREGGRLYFTRVTTFRAYNRASWKISLFIMYHNQKVNVIANLP